MMKKLGVIISVLIVMSCNFEQPTQFSEEVLSSKLISIDDEEISFSTVLEKHKGKKILIDVWASWCADCVRGFPTIKELQSNYPEVVFLFLSVDKSQQSWKKGISRFRLSGNHFLVDNDFDSELDDFLGLSWIPRYVVVNEQRKITLFKATKATDDSIIKALNKPNQTL